MRSKLEKEEAVAKTSNIPKPIMVRLLMLFIGGVGCLLVGLIVSLATGDLAVLSMSLILGASFIAKGFLLKKKINKELIFSVSGVCVSIAPKLFGRYKRIELVNTDTGDDVYFVLPKKVLFKIGHVYTCYFDNQLINNQAGDFDLPTNGFLGFQDFGVYQERPKITPTASVCEDEAQKNNKNFKEEE